MGAILGGYLKDLRIDKKLTLLEVEEKTKVSSASLSKIELGERGIPTMQVLIKLALLYGVPFSVLVKKAESELRFGKQPKGDIKNKKVHKTNPDNEFIRTKYNTLSEEKKNSVRDFVQYLQKNNI